MSRNRLSSVFAGLQKSTQRSGIRDRLFRPQEYSPNGTFPPEDEGKPTGARSWRVLLCGGFLLALIYVVMPYGIVAGGLYVGVSLGATVIVASALDRRLRLYRARGWMLLASGLVLTTVGHSLWYWFDFRGLEPFPSIAKICSLCQALATAQFSRTGS